MLLRLDFRDPKAGHECACIVRKDPWRYQCARKAGELVSRPPYPSEGSLVHWALSLSDGELVYLFRLSRKREVKTLRQNLALYAERSAST